MVTDPIADMFIRIKNSQAVGHKTALIPASKVKEHIAKILQESGYIENVTRKSGTPGDVLEIELRYHDKVPVISHLERISKPSLRRYSNVASIPRPLSGHGLVILSTPRGVMSGAQAEKDGVGGEIIATVW